MFTVKKVLPYFKDPFFYIFPVIEFVMVYISFDSAAGVPGASCWSGDYTSWVYWLYYFGYGVDIQNLYFAFILTGIIIYKVNISHSVKHATTQQSWFWPIWCIWGLMRPDYWLMSMSLIGFQICLFPFLLMKLAYEKYYPAKVDV